MLILPFFGEKSFLNKGKGKREIRIVWRTVAVGVIDGTRSLLLYYIDPSIRTFIIFLVVHKILMSVGPLNKQMSIVERESYSLSLCFPRIGEGWEWVENLIVPHAKWCELLLLESLRSLKVALRGPCQEELHLLFEANSAISPWY